MAGFNRAAEIVKRHKRIRKRVSGTSDRPRLCIAKTLRQLYVQIIDDEARVTLLQASTLEPAFREELRGANIASAERLGALLAERAKEKGVATVVFDRGGHAYHGVIKAFADACRKGGLQF
ncbi:50S ribosomal protein L18 [Candidatus Bipolaricaulota bacterium]|nr:50S ribosomal protein L18 [Candidatus Bipolaricaulota bacterium]TFH11696.1 MAG: 50S ribosomal protein L18 [Candidatus Atribacteria bacterium]